MARHDKQYAGRAGGDKRGKAEDRRRRKHWMLSKWGDGEACPCVHCGRTLTFETVEADRIEPGGSYRRRNVQPSCKRCNVSRGKKTSWISPLARRKEVIA